MSFHTKLARKALLMGHSPQDIRVGAQNCANAFWITAVIGVIVWFFAGWKWALIPFGYAVYKIFSSFSASLTAEEMAKLTGQQRPQ